MVAEAEFKLRVDGVYANNWMCLCRNPGLRAPDFGSLEGRAGE
jgi:hypothetical protein